MARARLARVALVALIVFAFPHVIFHAGHLEGFPVADAVAQTAGSVGQLLLAAGMLPLTWRLPCEAPRAT